MNATGRLANEDNLHVQLIGNGSPLPIRGPDRKSVPGAERKAESVTKREAGLGGGPAQTASAPGEFGVGVDEREPRSSA